MDVLLFRHGPAEDRDRFAATGRTDDERPLTPEGRDRTRAAATGLATLIAATPRIYTSPLTRACETAAIVAACYGGAAIKQTPDLAPGGRRDRLTARIGRTGTAILVGHEPDLGMLLGWFIAGTPEPVHAFKKAGVAAVRFDDGPTAGAGRLLWALPPRVLRALAP